MSKQQAIFQFPGRLVAMDGNTAVIHCERESSDAAGAFPITPSTQMGEYWAEAAASGHINISGRPLIFIEPEGEHAAAAVTAGLSMSGLRAANFSSGQGIAYMHESLYAAVGKRLTYVLNMGTRAMTKASLNVHAGHDDYHCVDDTGFFQLFAKNAQAAADLNIIAHRIAELALNPGIVAQDGFLTTHLIETIKLPERELIERYLGRPDDMVACPTAAQRILFGEKRRRIPELWNVDNPVMAGVVQNQDAYMQSVAAQRPFFFAHIRELAELAFHEYFQLTGRQYDPLQTYRVQAADYLIIGQGSMLPSAEVVADYLRETRRLKVGVINLLMFRPFPGDLLGHLLKGRKGVVILERVDQPLAEDLPMMREIRSVVSKCIENGLDNKRLAYPDLAVFHDKQDIPPLYSASFGLGSRDLQPEGLIAAIENMLPNGKHQKYFYLGIDFVHDKAFTPKQQIYQESITESYASIKELALRGSENPNLMPASSITVRFHSIGGWGAITTGKNLAITLFDLLGYHIKANPKYGSEKKGQPTTYYLSAAPEPIRLNCEYIYVDVVLSPDPNVFHHSHALAGLKNNGVFVLQSELPSPDKVWASIPLPYQKIIVEKDIRVFYLDAFKIAREEASDADLQLRMQGNAFQGAFFAASPLMEKAGFDESQWLMAIERQLQHKFGGKGARVVNDNLRVVKRGFDEIHEITEKSLTSLANAKLPIMSEPAIPVMLKQQPTCRQSGASDIHRFWEQTGNFYLRGLANENLADPFMALGTMPAVSSVFRDMTGIRFNHPQWLAENCTGCGNCYTVCPDTAIPGLVHELSQVLDTVLQRVKQRGHSVTHLPKAVRLLESRFRQLCNEADEQTSVRALLDEAMDNLVAEVANEVDSEAMALQQELQWFREAMGGFQWALTRPYYTLPEKKSPGSGGLFSLTINPYTCKGCMECIAVCNDEALRPITQTASSVEQLRQDWDLWLALPNTPRQYIRVENLEEGIGALETILLDKAIYLDFASGDGACMGCTEKTVLHLFIATVESLMKPRIERHMVYLDDLIARLEQHIQFTLVQEINVDDSEAMAKVISQMGDEDVSLSGIASQVEQLRGTQPIDRSWMKRVLQLVNTLKQLKWQYAEGITGKGRVAMGIINATGCSSVWGSSFPYNPYPFPWANHLFQDSPSMAMGVFEGHMAKMAEGFKAIRQAELELAGHYNVAEHETFFSYFNWQQFSEQEWLLCPPVAVVGGDGAMYDIGMQNLSRALMSGKPLKILVLDTQVYSNTGGQACTSGFKGQVSDMAPFGKTNPGKQEVRKEISLIAMAHRTSYVMQSTIAHPAHMIEGFIEGLQSRRPAIFNCYSACQPEHGIADDMGHRQAKLAVESRAYPLLRYHPDKGQTPMECFDLDGNPALAQVWPSYVLKYQENSREKSLELPMTFADFAMTEGRFRKHFRTAPPDTWHDNMMPLAEYLELANEQREDKYPFIWTIDAKQQLSRLLVSETMVQSCQDRCDFWRMLKAMAGVDTRPVASEAVEAKVRQEMLNNLASGLMRLVSGETPSVPDLMATVASGAETTNSPETSPIQQAGDYMAPWLDTEECTGCDECITINPSIFAYNENKKAFIKNPEGGPYRDLVKAAEKCTAQIIHPGLPRDRTEQDMEKWIKRGEKFN